ncbi:MAG: hypothetical protein WCC37_17625 [Candidatus Sulfotelmatobacter sp.]
MGGRAKAGEGGEVGVDELKKRRFLWGIGLAWAPWIPMLVGIGNVFKGISEQKATGVGAVAGGLSEMFVLWGIASIFISQVVAMVLLVRAFSPGHWARSLFSVVSISMSGLMLLLVGLSFWLAWFQAHHSF